MLKRNILAERLLECLGQTMSQAELGRQVGLSSATISTYTTGRTVPNWAVGEAIASVLNVSTNWLFGKDVAKVRTTGALSNRAIPLENLVFIPIVGSVSAGSGLLAADNIESYEPLLNSNLRGNSENYFFVQVQGDSMAPRIEQGDLALIKKANSVESGHLAIVLVDDMDGVIKKIKYGLDYVDLISLNPYYPPDGLSERKQTAYKSLAKWLRLNVSSLRS